MGFLSSLLTEVRAELRAQPLDSAALAAAAAAMPPPRPFAASLRGGAPALIAEVKRASPSAGDIAIGADPATQACTYADAGASAISVLTERRHFSGSLEDLRAVRRVVSVPVLRKDFLVDPSQVIEARAAGADAVLVIASAVSDLELDALLGAADAVGLGVLLEAHTDRDVERALATATPVIGVNARDLETLDVDTGAALALLSRIPADRVAVFESGIATRADVVNAVDVGASAVLVGEALMRAGDAGEKIRELLGQEARA